MADLQANSWRFQNEDFAPVLPTPNSGNDDWIPWGIFSDCTDDMTPNNLGINEGNGVIDNVEGYSIGQCFDGVINGNPTTVSQVEQNLINSLPAGQNVADVNTLFQTYGY